ncbi:MAG: cupin domain-containing protein [Candidatus Heimdallarchaeaceae archaeon]|jgi:mannose-6-phosphate isomerase-like protein (cupin superfamily)
MLIKKSEAKKFENSKDCTVWEYNIPSKDFSYVTALIDGRYPEKKRVINLDCEEIYFVVSGSGIVHSEKGDFRINKGDVYFFEKSEVYWIEGSQLVLAIVNIPKWTPEQHKIVN